jgi:hypothetical protein
MQSQAPRQFTLVVRQRPARGGQFQREGADRGGRRVDHRRGQVARVVRRQEVAVEVVAPSEVVVEHVVAMPPAADHVAQPRQQVPAARVQRMPAPQVVQERGLHWRAAAVQLHDRAGGQVHRLQYLGARAEGLPQRRQRLAPADGAGGGMHGAAILHDTLARSSWGKCGPAGTLRTDRARWPPPPPARAS